MANPVYILYNNRKQIGDNVGVYFYGTYDSYTIPKTIDDIKAMNMIDCGQLGSHAITNKKYLILAKHPTSDGIADVVVFDFQMLVANYANSVPDSYSYNLVIRWAESYSDGVFTSYEMTSSNLNDTTLYKAAPVSSTPSAYSRVNDLLIVTPTFNLTSSATAPLKYVLKSVGSSVAMAKPVNGTLTIIDPPRGLIVSSGSMSTSTIILILILIILVIVLVSAVVVYFVKKSKKVN
jgi:hypothetical protein